ncbi:GntR family transcriptional regulator [Streptomyces sp. NPDC006923]|uniref:GntR family transcriptional regulator n=1 Tax=Streptomyces sp. NPDC006923 TaxID=3155355 RepID=UPI0033D47F62
MSSQSPGEKSPAPYDATRLAEEIEARVTSGKLTPGEALPPARELAARYGVNRNTVVKAITALKARGILTGAAGGRTWVRVRPPQITRHNRRYQIEKDSVLSDDAARASYGVSEADSGIPVQHLYEDICTYEVVRGPEDVRHILRVPDDEMLLRRTYIRRHAERAGAGTSTSYLTYALASQNEALLDPSNEPWPGGTMHQLYTVGVELGRIDDHVLASMPTPEEQALLDIPASVPLLRVRKISYSTEGRAVEVSEIPLPGDRATLIYTTPLEGW